MKIAFINICISSLILFLTMPVYAKSKKNYCPERDFIEICLAPALNFQQMKEWAASHDWKWREDPRYLLHKTAGIFIKRQKNGSRQFRFHAVEFSDVTRIECKFANPPFFRPDPTKCDPAHSVLTQSLPESSILNIRKLSDGSEGRSWSYEIDNTSSRIYLGTKKDGNTSKLSITKYIFK